jgi:ketosteroid isomerase-like protein
MASGDRAELAALYALDAKLLSTASTAGGPDGRTIEGRDAIAGHYAGLLSPVENRKASLHRIFQRGTFVAAEWTLQGTLAPKGPVEPKKGKAAKNGEVGATLLSLFWIGEDGLVREQHDTLDASTLSDKANKSVTAAERPKVYVARGEATERDNLDTVRNLLLAFDSDPAAEGKADARGTGKAKTGDGFPTDTLSDAVERQDVALGRTHKGKAKVGEAYRRDARELGARSTQVLHSMAVQDFVVVETRTVGTAAASAGGKAAKAPTTVAQRAVEIYELRDGKVAKVWRFAGPFAADPAWPAASGAK